MVDFSKFQRLEDEARARYRDLVPPDDAEEFRVQPPSGGSAQLLAIVRVEQTGGVSGGLTTQCSWTYDIYPDSDSWASLTPLAEGLTPEKRRATVGPYLKAADGSRGLAYQFEGDWVLLIAYDEVEDVEECTTL